MTEKARREALKPDKEKLERLADYLSDEANNLWPEVKSSEANAALSRFQIALDNLLIDLRSDIEDL